MSDAEEQQLGAGVSTRIRARYGVVQSEPVHRYVTLVGMVLAQASSRPGLTWTFIVLDTDAVNAFAAPGGYVHITRGALALIRDEAELAGVLSHELVHITEKHTIGAIQKGKLVQMSADETVAGNSGLFDRSTDAATDVVLQGFGRGEEIESDRDGVALANKRGVCAAGARRVPDASQRAAQGRDGEARPVRVASRDEGTARSHRQADRGRRRCRPRPPSPRATRARSRSSRWR
jgi:predicted Zn-dependent protease